MHEPQVRTTEQHFPVTGALKEAESTRLIPSNPSARLVPDPEHVADLQIAGVAELLVQRRGILTCQRTRQQADEEDCEQVLA